MTTLTIPPNLIKEKDLVVIPKKVYKELVRAREQKIKEIKLNTLQNKALAEARRNLSKGKFLTTNELKHKLGISH